MVFKNNLHKKRILNLLDLTVVINILLEILNSQMSKESGIVFKKDYGSQF